MIGSGGALIVTLVVPAIAEARRRRHRRHAHRHHRLHQPAPPQPGSQTTQPVPDPLPEQPAQLSPLQRSSYAGLVGEAFGVTAVGGTAASVQLASVEDLNDLQAGSDDAFALVFYAPSSSPVLSDGLPEFSQTTLGNFPLMVVPANTDSGGQYYVAVINRSHA